MTTPSSNKRSPFGTYFRYRMHQQFRFAVITFILNALGIGFFSATSLSLVKNQYINRVSFSSGYLSPEFTILSDGLVALSTIAALALALFGAISAFDYCLKNDHTDTFYGLPVTLRGKFWADFLSGFISRVATLIPCSVFSMIISISVDDYYNKLFLLEGDTYESGYMIKLFAELNLTLFFTYMIAYALSVIITVCCGRTNSSVVFTSISTIIPMITGCVVSGFVTVCRVGADDIGNIIPTSLENTPPLGTFFIKIKGTLEMIYGNDEKFYEFTSPTTYVIYTLVIVVIIAAAYFIFKHRRPENTGRPIAVRSFYYVFSGIIAFTVIGLCCLIMYPLHMWWLSALISVVAAGITLLIFTVSNRKERSDFKKNMIRSGIVIAGCIALLFITDKTGVFGARYYNISPAKTQSIEVSFNDYTQVRSYRETILIDNKSDIEQFINSTNQTLKKRSDELEYGSAFDVTYNLADGKTVRRRYSSSSYANAIEKKALTELCENVYNLDDYPRYSSVAASKLINNTKYVRVVMHDKFGEITIPPERVEELNAVISREILEKHDKNAKRVGIVIIADSSNKIDRRYYGGYDAIPILDCYTDTIGLAESLRVYDGNEEAFNITNGWDFALDVSVKIKDADGEAEKELFSLLEPITNYRQEYSSGFSIFASNQVDYYVPDENKEHVIDLMLTIIEKNFTQTSP